jgi:hypothetical protein
MEMGLVHSWNRTSPSRANPRANPRRRPRREGVEDLEVLKHRLRSVGQSMQLLLNFRKFGSGRMES